MPFDNPHQTQFGDIDLLLNVRSRLSNKNDWVQGRFHDGDRLCLVAALSVAAGSSDFQTPNRTEQRLARLVAARLPEKVPSWAKSRLFTARQRLQWFNDSRRTTHDDVLALLDGVIGALSQAPAYV